MSSAEPNLPRPEDTDSVNASPEAGQDTQDRAQDTDDAADISELLAERSRDTAFRTPEVPDS